VRIPPVHARPFTWKTDVERLFALLEEIGLERFLKLTERADAKPRGTVAGRMVPADTCDCGYTEAECHGGGSGSGLTYGQTCGYTCEYDQCGPNYTIFSCCAGC
jgi:hypothetical protein